MWRDRILSILNDEYGSREKAAQLKTALKRDEVTKETHDEFVTFCLGEYSMLYQLSPRFPHIRTDKFPGLFQYFIFHFPVFFVFCLTNSTNRNIYLQIHFN